MKTYRQYCAIARSLDVVGDRWVLLIVRELLALGPSRYSDLRRGLPGIATNLLAERLKTMEREGLIERHVAPPPVDATLYQLTDNGKELTDVLHALARWGLHRMTAGPRATDAVQPHWAALLGGLMLPDRPVKDTEVVLGIESEGDSLHVVLSSSGLEIRRGASPDAAVTLTGPAQLVGAILTRLLSADQAVGQGLVITGDRRALDDLLNPVGATA